MSRLLEECDDLIFHITQINSPYDKTITQEQQHDVYWYDLVELLNEHQVVGEKDDAPLFNGYRFINGKQIAENVVSVDLLILDIDGEMSINAAQMALRGIEHCGYTSFSHRTPKKNGKDCFRIVMPLYNTVDIVTYYKKVPALKELFKCDPASFAVSRGFYMPSCSAEMVDLAKTWHHFGEFFDMNEIDDYVEPVMATNDFATDDLTQEERQKWVEKLSAHNLGYEPGWFIMAGAMKALGFSETDFVNVTAGCMNSKTTSDAIKKWRNTKAKAGTTNNIALGTLTNVLKGKHNR